jgi:hypothetical protein
LAPPGAGRTRRHRPPAVRRLDLECLEHRTVLSSVTLTVSSLADTGSGTLRAAITAADGGAAKNSYVIDFTPNLTGTITLESALPALSNNISLDGPGASSLTVQRDPNAVSSFGIFAVTHGTVGIAGLTIAGGNTQGNGGGISNGASLTVSNCVLTQNSASSGSGGGLYNQGSLTVIGCTLTENSAFWGGGIGNDSEASAQVSSSTIENNSGDGIFNFGPNNLLTAGSLTIKASTVCNNSGADLYNNGTATVTNSDVCVIVNAGVLKQN